ncbi:enoyl-CoA hydratase/isomerase family protein [Pseudonocardia alni]|uniref:enoyl-CoA hydratase/isomerase family protein n=1 Tax=Pseudonocardia alni TaxID=33907 RepID=UPI001AD7491A|nr:enoyl-CoA hydratase-related protein [Pseudonocardia alni]MBO4239386.1 enoyl-CoA hydratase/isomerase family protein [Pseudonocardia alni]
MTTTDTTHTGTAQVLFDLDDDGVGRLRLNRPEASNGMNVPFLRALHEAVMTATGRPELRVLLLTGEGENFCAGGDVKTFAAKGEALPDYLREATAWLQNVAQALLALPVPVVAAVHGFAAGGGGLGLVCASDIVLAGESAKFMSGAARVGMAPDAGSSVTLPQLVGLRKAMEILLLNPTLTAADAAEIGLITRVVADHALHDEALAVARTLAAGAPRALGAVKRLVWSGLGNRVEAQLPEEARTVSELSGTADAREGLAAVLERRSPRFTGR